MITELSILNTKLHLIVMRLFESNNFKQFESNLLLFIFNYGDDNGDSVSYNDKKKEREKNYGMRHYMVNSSWLLVSVCMCACV